MIGLSFTFPKGINNERLLLKGKYQKAVSQIPSTEEIILRLERFASALFSYSFMVFMITIGVYIFLLVTAFAPVIAVIYFFPEAMSPKGIHPLLLIYLFLVLVISVIGLIDFVSLGGLKRIKWINAAYWPIYKLIGWLTLSRFYRPIFYVLITRVPRWKVIFGALLFTLSSFYWINESDTEYPGEQLSQISLWSSEERVSAFAGLYDDQSNGIESHNASIQSDILTGNTIRLFLVGRADRDGGNHSSSPC